MNTRMWIQIKLLWKFLKFYLFIYFKDVWAGSASTVFFSFVQYCSFVYSVVDLFCCHFSNFNTFFSGALCSKCSPPEDVFKVIFWLGYCNSMMNPVIYGFSSKEFKRAFRNILTCKCRQKSHSFKQIQRYSFYDHQERSNSNFSSPNEKMKAFKNNISEDCLEERESDSGTPSLRSHRNPDLDLNYLPLGKCYLTANAPSFDSESVSISDNVLEELREEQQKPTDDE